MKKITLIIFLAILTNVSAQCDIKTTKRPDGNTIKYFNPKPVIRLEQYEVGTGIYKNETSGMYMIAITVLFNKMAPKDISGKLTIQTTGVRGLELKLLKSEQMEMNSRKLVLGLYEIDKVSLAELKKHSLKSLYFYLDKKMYGSTVTENKSICITEIKCLM